MLGKFEEAVMLGVLTCDNACHPSELITYLTKNGLQDVKSGAVVTTLKRLEQTLFISMRPSPSANSRPRYLYSVTHTGRLNLTRSIVITGRLVAKARTRGNFIPNSSP